MAPNRATSKDFQGLEGRGRETVTLGGGLNQEGLVKLKDYFNSKTSFSFALLISSIFLISSSVSR